MPAFPLGRHPLTFLLDFTVKFIPPGHPALVPLIKGYYVHQSTAPDFRQTVTFYPNYTTNLSITLDVKNEWRDDHLRHTHSPDAGFATQFTGRVDHFRRVEIFGPLNRLGIVFHPLGFNHFIPEPLGPYVHPFTADFHYFDADFSDLLPRVFTADELIEKQSLLDVFFLSRLSGPPDTRLQACVTNLLAAETLPRVDELATSQGISRRTLLRLFKKHLGYSVEEYLAIVRFRRALLYFHRVRRRARLSEIAYASAYYDQADFTRQLKIRSGLTPRQLFDQLEFMDEVLFWKLG